LLIGAVDLVIGVGQLRRLRTRIREGATG
jgi:hypothetical protein